MKDKTKDQDANTKWGVVHVRLNSDLTDTNEPLSSIMTWLACKLSTKFLKYVEA